MDSPVDSSTDEAQQRAAAWYDPAGRPYRFAVLFFASLLTLGSYFAYDSISAIVPQLMSALPATREQISITYTTYSVAAIVSVLVGGVLLDRIGTRRASLLFSVLVTLGTLIVAFSPNLWTMYVGRLIFGCGAESLAVAQSAVLARWFKGKELAFSFGVSLAISRLGTLLAFNTEALIADRAGFRAALYAAFGLCVVSLLGNLIYNWMDHRAEGRLGLSSSSEGAGEVLSLGHLSRFPRSYYYVVGLCVTFYSAIFGFTALSTDFFHEKYGLPLTAGGGGGLISATFANFRHMFSTAPGTSSIIIFASLCFAPIAGGLVDRIGHRGRLMMIGAALLVPCYLLMALTRVAPAGPMVLLGASFVLIPAAMWPMVSLLVERERVGTAFGLMTMIQNVGLALFPWLNGRLRDVTHDYVASNLMFASLGGVGLIFAVLLYRADRATAHGDTAHASTESPPSPKTQTATEATRATRATKPNDGPWPAAI